MRGKGNLSCVLSQVCLFCNTNFYSTLLKRTCRHRKMREKKWTDLILKTLGSNTELPNISCT